eukprot:jgi/Ulvmu1/4218/UM019_0197.1
MPNTHGSGACFLDADAQAGPQRRWSPHGSASMPSYLLPRKSMRCLCRGVLQCYGVLVGLVIQQCMLQPTAGAHGATVDWAGFGNGENSPAHEGEGLATQVGRKLADDPASVLRFVATARELFDAVQDGARHIVVQQHLDLRRLHLDDPSLANKVAHQHNALGALFHATHSLTGRCHQPPSPEMMRLSGPPLKPLQPEQCLLLAADSFLALRYKVWVHNLYFRLHRPAKFASASRVSNSGARVDALLSMAYSAVSDDAIWITQCVFQGDGWHVPWPMAGIETSPAEDLTTSRLFAEDVHFLNLGGVNQAVVTISVGSRLVRCSFSEITASMEDPPRMYRWNKIGGVIIAGWPRVYGPGDIKSDVAVWLQGCTFSNNTLKDTHALVSRHGMQFYSDGPEPVYLFAETEFHGHTAVDIGGFRATVQPQAEPPNPGAFLAADDEFVRDTAKMLWQVLRARMEVLCNRL